MTDNKTPTGASFKVATREVTYSGETADIQAIGLATVSGSDDAKTATDVSATNPLPGKVISTGTAVDSNNSDTTPLNAGATFTGTATDCLGYASVSTLVYTPNRVHGIYYEWSTDGTNWDWTKRIGYTLPGNGNPFQFVHSTVKARYFRIRVVNEDGSNESTMRVQTLLHTHPGAVQVSGMGPITGTNMEGLAPMAIAAYDVVTGGYRVIKTGGDGALLTNPAYEVSLGQTTWTSATALNTVVTLNTDGYRGLRLVINTNSVSSTGALEVYREPVGAPSANEKMPLVLTDQTAIDAVIRLRSYIMNGTVGDIYIDTGGAVSIGIKLTAAITTGTFTFTAYASPMPVLGIPMGLKHEDEASSSSSFAGDLGMPAMAVRKATPANTSGADADYEMLQMSNGLLWTQEGGAALTSLQLMDDAIKADDAAFTVATDKVNMAGALAVAIGSDPDAADANDAVVTLTNRHRVQFTIGGHPNVTTVKHTTITTAVTDAAIITVGSGNKICVTRITVTLDNASTVFPTVLVGFGTANTPTTTGVVAAHGGVPAGGGFTIGDGSGVIGQGADNEDLRVTTTGNATGNGLQIVVSYFVLPS